MFRVRRHGQQAPRPTPPAMHPGPSTHDRGLRPYREIAVLEMLGDQMPIRLRRLAPNQPQDVGVSELHQHGGFRNEQDARA
eukprot:m.481007 g.481007  ORF g.481007 m.481007 type:complete len:81 (+) comp21713_c0_seq5:1780-2022(+)